MEYPLPNFLIIGAMKSGTSSLYDDLKISEAFDLPDVKEPGVLVKVNTLEEAINRYKLHFKNTNKNKIRGDGSTYYTMQPLFPDISQFAKKLCGPKLKLVVILRNPVDRLVSHIRHDYTAGRLKHRDVEQALIDDSRYLAFSDYVMQLTPWVKTFGMSNIYCVSFSDYVKDRLYISKEVANFLGADPSSISSRTMISNQNSDIRRSILPVNVTEHYRLHIRKFIPQFLHQVGRNMISKPGKKPDIDFPDELISNLNKRFSDMEEKLYNLTGKEIKLFTNSAP